MNLSPKPLVFSHLDNIRTRERGKKKRRNFIGAFGSRSTTCHGLSATCQYRPLPEHHLWDESTSRAHTSGGKKRGKKEQKIGKTLQMRNKIEIKKKKSKRANVSPNLVDAVH